jgi:23S rRNA (adenine2503-C2)-methyltransferase
VVIPEGERVTLCLSSQVGCAVACRFCASGLGGVVRNLSQGEIIEQILVAREARPESPLTNYVFMGSGEPTHNMKALLGALSVMNDPDGLGIGARRITVSTIGHPQAVRQLAAVEIPFNLALSVHMPTDSGREQVMPGLGRSDLRATLAAARERFAATGRRLTIEVVVMSGLNDRDEDARAFARLLSGLPAAVNLIPWNAVDGMDLQAPEPTRVAALAELLRRAGITTTVRRARGQDVGVACGQLRRRADGS